MVRSFGMFFDEPHCERDIVLLWSHFHGVTSELPADLRRYRMGLLIKLCYMQLVR